MGLEEIVKSDGSLPEDTTVGELVDHYGEEPVRRGLAYTASLSDADKNYRESSKKAGKYGDRYSDAVVEDGSEANTDRLEESWAESVENSGIGLDE